MTIEFVDQTVRDGQQSLWGMRMRAGHMLPIADQIDQAGYSVVDLTGSNIFPVTVKEFRENPYEALDLMTAALPRSVLRAGRRPNSMGFHLQPAVVVDLFAKTLVDHGISSFWIFDCLFNLEQMERFASTVGRLGAEVVPTISYSLSEVHTDEFFVGVARAMASWPHVDAIQLADESGSLTPERAATLIPKLVDAAGGLPVELHCHNTTGLAPLNYLVGAGAGIQRLHTASRPLANGPSLPSIEQTLINLRRSGYSDTIDDERVADIAEYFTELVDRRGFPSGTPVEFDARVYDHQLPGGMTGTLKKQLASYGMSDRFDEILEEVAVVRRELGYPVMATPFSQLIGIQSVLNLVGPERYGILTDEVVSYALGHYGTPPAPIDPEVMQRVLDSPRAKELRDWTLEEPSLSDLRRAYGTDLSDEELVLAIMVPESELLPMYAAGPVARDLSGSSHPLVERVRRLVVSTSLGSLSVATPDFELRLARA